MEQHYKSFMDKQQPSAALIKDTIQKAKNPPQKTSYKWQFAAAVIVIFLLAGGIWKWNFSITYTDLNQTAVTANAQTPTDENNVGQIQKSYLGNMEASSYIFDSGAELSEAKIGNGTIKIQTGTVLNTGLQALYQTTPERIKGYDVYLGTYKADSKDILLAAFVINNRQYYLEGKDITEKEMTAVVKNLIKEQG